MTNSAIPTPAQAGLHPSLAWIADMGFTCELAGGGAINLARHLDNGAHVLLTQYECGGLPEPDSWHVGVYPAVNADALWNAAHYVGTIATPAGSDPSPLTLRQAVNAALAIAETCDPAPPSYSAEEIGYEITLALNGSDRGVVYVANQFDDSTLVVTTSSSQRFIVTVRGERTDQEIVDQTDALAREMLERDGYKLDDHTYNHRDPRVGQAWRHACIAFETLQATPADEALANVTMGG